MYFRSVLFSSLLLLLLSQYVFSFRDTSENVFQEALKTYCDNNKSRREYEKRMGMITDEERLRVKEFIEQLEAQRKKPQ